MSESEADLKRNFLEDNREARIANSRVGCMLATVLMPFGTSLDYFVYPEHWAFFLELRILCSILAFAIWALLGMDFGRRHYRFFGLSWFILPSLFISLMIYYSEGIKSPYYAGLTLVLIAVSWVAQVQFVEALLAVILTLIMYSVACYLNGATSSMMLFNNYYFIVLNGIVVVIGSYIISRLRLGEYALRIQVDKNRKELEVSNARLVEMDKAKSDFFANVSHELRTPLTLLIGPLDRMRNESAPPSAAEQGELVDIMYNNAMRLLRLINDLLNLVKLDSGSLQLRVQKIELLTFLQGVAQSVMPMAKQRNLRFETNLSPDTATQVYLDRDKVEKILLNLLFNAFKFTPSGGLVQLHAEFHNQHLQLAVSDTGKGISRNDLPHIFDRFWQAEAAATRRYQGVGIGLALVKELAQLHGGSVSADSEPGEGTTIGVQLDVSERPGMISEDVPLDEPETQNTEWLVDLYRRAEFFPAHVHAAPAPSPASSDTPAPSIADNGNALPSVLVADDEPEMRRFLKSQLQSVFTVREALNGADAVRVANEHDFNLILLDYMMPELDGVEVARQLRQLDKHRSVPIIILTARADEDSKMKALEAGATDFLTKPFASTELMVRCRNLVSAHQLQQQFARQARDLASSIEQIKETETQFVLHAKMASLGQLSAGLMHEINNPLNFANTALHLLKKRMGQLPPEEQTRFDKPIQDMQDGIKRVSSIISSLRSFTHPEVGAFTNVHLAEIVQEGARFVQINPDEIKLEINIDNSLTVWGNQNQLIHLFINLFQNAVDSLRTKAAPLKELRVQASLQNGEVRTTVYDNGVGVPEENRAKIFDAFFTTKAVGAGVGLGLNICYRIIKQHEGRIDLESQAGEFCRFIVFLPAKPNPNT